jgi:hypothetical protein
LQILRIKSRLEKIGSNKKNISKLSNYQVIDLNHGVVEFDLTNKIETILDEEIKQIIFLEDVIKKN